MTLNYLLLDEAYFTSPHITITYFHIAITLLPHISVAPKRDYINSRTTTKKMEAFIEQTAIYKWLHLTNLNWCQTYTTHFLSRYIYFSVVPPLLIWHEQESFYSQCPGRPGSTSRHILQKDNIGIQESSLPPAIHTTALSSLMEWGTSISLTLY